MKNRVTRFNIRKERKRKRVFRRQRGPEVGPASSSLLRPKPPIDIGVETTLRFKVTQVSDFFKKPSKWRISHRGKRRERPFPITISSTFLPGPFTWRYYRTRPQKLGWNIFPRSRLHLERRIFCSTRRRITRASEVAPRCHFLWLFNSFPWFVQLEY